MFDYRYNTHDLSSGTFLENFLMEFPTELEIETILQDLDGSKYPASPLKTSKRIVNEDHMLLDDLIAQLEEDSIVRSNNTNVLPMVNLAMTALPKSKCIMVYLSGTSTADGLYLGGKPKSCDHLRCIGCDFQVMIFPKSKWNLDVDYLFFRNSVPESCKLRSKLEYSQEYKAYCCQCQWTSIRRLEPPNAFHNAFNNASFNQSKWTCGGHSL